jgi:hypothetical protein
MGLRYGQSVARCAHCGAVATWRDSRFARQYEHIKESYEERGRSEDKAEEIAARTVNKERAERGETKAQKERAGRR